MEPSLNPETLAEIREALKGGHKIAAIRLYREATHVSLADAKSAVDAIDAGIQPPRYPASPHVPSAIRLARGFALVLAIGLCVGAWWLGYRGDAPAQHRWMNAASLPALAWLILQGAINSLGPDRRKFVGALHMLSGLLLLITRIMMVLKA